MIKENRNINTADDYNEWATEMLHCMIERVQELPWSTRRPNEDDPVDDDFSFMWTRRAIRLIEDYKSRLYRVGDKYFPNEIEIEDSILYQDC